MLNINKALLLLLMILPCMPNVVKAENDLSNNNQSIEESSSSAPMIYPMKIIYIFEAEKPEFIFVVGNAGFKSIASLKDWIKNLPPRTTLEFDMTCRRLGNEPLISSEEEMDDFKNFCKQHNINLVIRPAG